MIMLFLYSAVSTVVIDLDILFFLFCFDLRYSNILNHMPYVKAFFALFWKKFIFLHIGSIEGLKFEKGDSLDRCKAF